MHDCTVYGEHTSGFKQDFFSLGGGGGCKCMQKGACAHVSAPTRFFKLNFGISKDKNH